MIWLKSALVGMVAMLVFGAVAAVVYPMILNRNSETQGLIGVDWISLVKNSPIAWVLLLFAFGAGFAWQYRRMMN